MAIAAQIDPAIRLVEMASQRQKHVGQRLDAIDDRLTLRRQRRRAGAAARRRAHEMRDHDGAPVGVGRRQQPPHPGQNTLAGVQRRRRGNAAGWPRAVPIVPLEVEDDEVHAAGAEQLVVVVHAGGEAGERVVVAEVAAPEEAGLPEHRVIKGRRDVFVGAGASRSVR